MKIKQLHSESGLKICMVGLCLTVVLDGGWGFIIFTKYLLTNILRALLKKKKSICFPVLIIGGGGCPQGGDGMGGSSSWFLESTRTEQRQGKKAQESLSPEESYASYLGDQQDGQELEILSEPGLKVSHV